MDVLLWASILVAIFSLLGILLLVVAAWFCMPDRHSGGLFPPGGKAIRKDHPELVIQITQAEEQPIHGMVTQSGRTPRDQAQQQSHQHVQQRTPGLATMAGRHSAGAVAETGAQESVSHKTVFSSVPNSVASPQYVPMHAVPHSVPASVPASTISPQSIPSDWFNKSDEPSLSEFMTTQTSDTK